MIRRPTLPAVLPFAAGPVLAVAATLGGPAPAAVAAVPAVTTTADGGPGSLRAAVTAAGAAGEPAVIDVPAGTYVLSRCGADDTGAAGDLDLRTAAAVTLRAPAGGVTVRQVCPGERVLQARGGGRLTLRNVVLTGGSVTAPPGADAEGGGVWADGDVVLDRTTVTGNSARAGDGGDADATGTAPGGGGRARGGGLWVGGRLVTAKATLSGNVAAGGAGGDTAPGSTLTGGPGGAAEGGGAYVGRGALLTGGVLEANSAAGGTGGAADGGLVTGEDGSGVAFPGGAGGAARGGGIAQAAGATGAVGLAGVRTAGNLAAGGAVGAYRAELPQFVPDAEFPPGGDAAGGAVAAAGPLAVARATASGDRALGGDSSGKCSFCATGPTSGAARGGWLQAAGAAVVALSTADGARADSGEAEFLLTGRLQFQLGYPSGPATGGAVDAGRDLTLTATSVSGSRARKGEGRAPAPASSAGGAAHAAGRLTVTGGRFTGNVAGRDALDVLGGAGGALAGADVRLTGVTLDANVAAAAGGGAWSSGPLTATRTAFTGNRGGLHGGGAHADGALTATDVRATGNAADGLGLNTGTLTGTGGGLDADGALRLTRTTVTGNSGNVVFDAVGFGRLPGAFAGAGVHGGSVVAVDSTVAGNDALGLEVPPPPGEPVPPSRRTTGAGVHAAGAADLTNTTVSDNRLDRRAFSLEDTPTERAGGVAAADLRLVHATITGNTVVESTPFAPEPQPAAAAGALQAERLTAVGTVVVPAPGLRTCVAGVSAAGPSSYDVLGDATCTITGPGVRTTAAGAALGPVADNGGPVPTQLPGPGSTLVDAVPVAACPVSADARGVPRPQGPACDVGAVEVTPAGG